MNFKHPKQVHDACERYLSKGIMPGKPASEAAGNQIHKVEAWFNRLQAELNNVEDTTLRKCLRAEAEAYELLLTRMGERYLYLVNTGR